jgi:aldose 1-epimerase
MITSLYVASTGSSPAAAALKRIEVSEFGKTTDGQPVKIFTLRNARGMTLKAMELGAILTQIQAPDRKGAIANVILGGDSFEQYAKGFAGSAAVIGRVANRIGGARFMLDGVEYKVAANSGANHIHGGRKGFSQMIWQGRELPARELEASVQFSYTSKDGEEGYPGNLKVNVTYVLTDDNEVRLEYEAETDKPTPINLTNHAYFNLAGSSSGEKVYDHILWLAADQYTPANEQLIPTGEIAPVKGTPLDFTTATAIGARMEQFKPKLNGYDHNFVINGGGRSIIRAARVQHPKSGRAMEVKTTEPGVQLYTANHLNHAAFCLETQHYPDSVNHPNFPSTILRPGEKFRSTTIYAFSVEP